MARSQHRSKRKVSGGRYHFLRTKRKYELVGFTANTKVSNQIKTTQRRGLGGNIKMALLSTNQVNVSDRRGKATKTEIIKVIENPANSNLVRRNIITKGCVVETKLGKVKITSRTGQEGTANGVLI